MLELAGRITIAVLLPLAAVLIARSLAGMARAVVNPETLAEGYRDD